MTSSFSEVIVLVEGQTEQLFVKRLLAPYLINHNVYPTPIILSKPGQKGGDVKFARVRKDIERHLKQRWDTWITLLVDYYGIKADWPDYAKSKQQAIHYKKAEIIMRATSEVIQTDFSNYCPHTRFIPYVSMYEIEALYFSDPVCLAEKLGIPQARIDTIIQECGEPEKINDHAATAPSKRLEKLFSRFKKTSTGIAVAEAIGIAKMREACPLFHHWVTILENLKPHPLEGHLEGDAPTMK